MLMDLYFVPAGKMGEEFTLHEGIEDHLLDTLSILELNGDLARTNISNARAAFKRLFPHFFLKETQPKIFLSSFNASWIKRILPWSIGRTT
jgi:hypothetical protein